MLYRLFKIPAKLLLWIYIRKLRINDPAVLKHKGPLLIAANHPNSFLDAIILAAIFKKPVYSLTRGDAFNNKFIAKLLTAVNMLPVYRTSEGVENMEHNYATFRACREIFRQGGIVLIFSEGLCINEWHLRPLKKGTARLAISSWAEGIPLQVLPAGLNYDSFDAFGKTVHLNMGKMITAGQVDGVQGEGRNIHAFNEVLSSALRPLVYEMNGQDKKSIEQKFGEEPGTGKRILLFLPAVAGWLANIPLYYFIQRLAVKNNRYNSHFDSLILSYLFFAYPLYLLLWVFAAYCFAGPWAWALLLLLPFCAWSYVQLKRARKV